MSVPEEALGAWGEFLGKLIGPVLKGVGAELRAAGQLTQAGHSPPGGWAASRAWTPGGGGEQESQGAGEGWPGAGKVRSGAGLGKCQSHAPLQCPLPAGPSSALDGARVESQV